MARKYSLAVFIGRFQPVHKGHIHVIQEGLKIADRVLVLIGSAFKPSDVKNPWTWQERSDMLFSCFSPPDSTRIVTNYSEDVVYNDPKWVASVQRKVSAFGATDNKICIIGHHKDESSYYLDMFPQWDLIDVGNHQMYNSTDIRKIYFDQNSTDEQWKLEADKMHPAVVNTLLEYYNEPRYNGFINNLLHETEFYREHDEMWKDSPYTPIFVTADAVVFQAGHVLLIRRGRAPGKNLLALPGGYLEPNETLYESAIRELKEETRLKVPVPVLKGSRFDDHVFDHPKRSLRGRIITHAFAFNLERLDAEGQLQEIRGSEDPNEVQEVMWVPLYKLQTPEYKCQMFEDHGEIIQYFVDRMKWEWK